MIDPSIQNYHARGQASPSVQPDYGCTTAATGTAYVHSCGAENTPCDQQTQDDQPVGPYPQMTSQPAAETDGDNGTPSRPQENTHHVIY